MRVVVTGSAGLVGGAVCLRLTVLGHEVVGVDIAPSRGNAKDQVGVDLLDWPSWLELMLRVRPEAVVHTAGWLTPAVEATPSRGLAINYQGTVHVLEAARLTETRRVVFCSSSTVYDHARVVDRPIREDDPIFPRSLYATTKIAGEYTGLNYARRYGFEFVALRLAAVYGPGPSQSGVAGLWIDPLLRRVKAGLPAEVRRPTRRALDYVYVEDAAQALVQATLRPHLASPAYNIGEGRLRSFDEILEAIRQLCPEAEVRELSGERQTSPYAEASQPMDISRARQELGYRVEFPLPQAVEDYLSRLD